MSWHPDRLWGWHPRVKSDDRTFGQRAADHMKAVLATWAALISVLAFIALWMLSNGGGTDVKPWIELNLVLSCFAALQCFVLLISAKRGEQIAADIAQHTYENTCSDTQLLEETNALVQQDKDLTEEVHRLSSLLYDHLLGSSPGPTAQQKRNRRT